MTSIPPFVIHEYLRGQRGARMSNPTLLAHKVPPLKEYARFPRIKLPEPNPIETALSRAIEGRKSLVNAGGLAIPTIEQISSTLKHSLGIKKDGNRPAPSGGGLYPIEAYLLGDVTGSGNASAYHYHPKEHSLEEMWGLPRNAYLDDLVSLSENKGFPIYVVLTGVWNRSAYHYGNFAHQLAMLEVGHISQNILLCASALNISTCPIGGFSDVLISELLDLNKNEEQPILFIGLGVNQNKNAGL